jgi:hypothetical protein
MNGIECSTTSNPLFATKESLYTLSSSSISRPPPPPPLTFQGGATPPQAQSFTLSDPIISFNYSSPYLLSDDIRFFASRYMDLLSETPIHIRKIQIYPTKLSEGTIRTLFQEEMFYTSIDVEAEKNQKLLKRSLFLSQVSPHPSPLWCDPIFLETYGDFAKVLSTDLNSCHNVVLSYQSILSLIGNEKFFVEPSHSHFLEKFNPKELQDLSEICSLWKNCSDMIHNFVQSFRVNIIFNYFVLIFGFILNSIHTSIVNFRMDCI